MVQVQFLIYGTIMMLLDVQQLIKNIQIFISMINSLIQRPKVLCVGITKIYLHALVYILIKHTQIHHFLEQMMMYNITGILVLSKVNFNYFIIIHLMKHKIQQNIVIIQNL